MDIIMDSKYQPQLVEEKIYKEWEEKGYFKAEVNKNKEPFSIILPPPNANGSLHLGHAMFTYEDIMIRFNKMMGKETLWLLGLDHAGTETQFVFEKHLKKLGKSRYDYKREDLYKMIWDYVAENKNHIKGQLKRLGFALDWSREKFTMDPEIVKIVYKTFEDLFNQGLVYRANKLINYCTNCGTSFSDLEVAYVEKTDSLFYINYQVKEGGNIEVATTRPETLFGDTAVIVNPKDKRYKDLIGKTAIIPFINREVPIIADRTVDIKFGTGAVKVTPAHDFNDYEVAKKYNLPMVQVIEFDGKLNKLTGKYCGLRIFSARQQIVTDLQAQGLMVKIEEDYLHRVGTCYRCGRVLEPLPKEQWFIKVKPLADQAKELIEKKETVVLPKRFKKRLTTILDDFIDWNISRQVVWGIRIPAYRCKTKNNWFISTDKPDKCQICGKNDFEQDEDTFDTWFSSAQWPFATLMTEGSETFDYFYPTSVMETGHDILRAWVARMMMIGYFSTKKTPFKTIFLHGMIRDPKGQKMSKSKGNVIDPILMIDKYGADALRATLIFGIKEGGDISLSEQKIIGMRNFINKIWNIGRFIEMNNQVKIQNLKVKSESKNSKVLKELEKESKKEKKQYLKYMDSYQFSKALGLIYEFIWHRFADYYIEQLKDEIINGNIEALGKLKEVYLENLKMLHPFIPFVTEEVWGVFEKKSILESSL
ncbi:MAG: valine--tRNA ligase [Patescibacteria group bacterium]|jgi:valyl-tRNA synthetase